MDSTTGEQPWSADTSMVDAVPSSPVANSSIDEDTLMEDNQDVDVKEESTNEETTNSKKGQHRTYQTLLASSKARHLKKNDGEPLWRIDIQYDFLSYVFRNDLKVFTNAYDGTGNHSFADIYIDAMARSSKCSKVLHDKLLGDREAGLNMAMVCLLVNIGRMNTTLNFFPEMRAQLRTYHAIPSLQTYSNQSDYKQLQDAPRLKSILKGACEDRPEPSSLEEMASNGIIPHTNPINLIFLLSTFASRVQDRFFPAGYQFFDVIMNKKLSSPSRGRVFLWLVWAYLETDLEPEQLKRNPFNNLLPGETPFEITGTSIPPFKELTDEEEARENKDTTEEIEFGESMRKVRHFYLEESNNSVPAPLRAIASKRKRLSSGPIGGNIDKKKASYLIKGEHGSDGTERSPSPSKSRNIRVQRRIREDMKEQRCQKEIDRMLVKMDHQARQHRYRKGTVKMYWDLIKDIDPLYDSDEEVLKDGSGTNGSRKKKKQGTEETNAVESTTETSLPTQPTQTVNHAPSAYGEENNANLRSLRRSYRWIDRWEDIRLKEQEQLIKAKNEILGDIQPENALKISALVD